MPGNVCDAGDTVPVPWGLQSGRGATKKAPQGKAAVRDPVWDGREGPLGAVRRPHGGAVGELRTEMGTEEEEGITRDREGRCRDAGDRPPWAKAAL